MKSNSTIRTAMLQRLLQGGACLRGAHASAWVRVQTGATLQGATPKMGFAMAGAAFGALGLAGNAAGNSRNGSDGVEACSFDPVVVARTS